MIRLVKTQNLFYHIVNIFRNVQCMLVSKQTLLFVITKEKKSQNLNDNLINVENSYEYIASSVHMLH